MIKLLLVEDDKQLSEMYARKFDKEGYQVTLAHDSNSGINLIKAEHFDIIVLDLMLPGLTGLEILEIIRTEKKTAKTPVIVYTNYGDSKNKEKCLLYGADDFILKIDTDPEELCQKIGKLLTERKIEAL